MNYQNRDILDGESVLHSVFYNTLLVCRDSDGIIEREMRSVVKEFQDY